MAARVVCAAVLSLAVPAAPVSAADPVAAPPTVPVRSGAHPTFDRFVFDWARAVDYEVTRAAGEAVVRFDRPGAFDLAVVRRNLPPLVRGIAARADGTAVAFDLAADVQLRHFRSGTSIVIDVMRPAPGRPPPAASEPKPATAPQSRPAPEPPPARVPAPVPAASALVSEAAPTSLLPATKEPAQGRAVTVAIVRDAVPTILTLEPEAAVIRFHWPEEVDAAVFTRAGHLWAVFGREGRFAVEGWDAALAAPSPNSNRRPEERPAAAFVARPELSAVLGASVFRMRVPEGVSPRVAREGVAWVVTLERSPLRPATGVPVESHVGAASGARLFLAVADAGSPLAVPDPEVGDRLWVVPLGTPGRGIGLARSYAEVELLATAQGIAGHALGDDIAFHALPRGIEIGARAGLALSGVVPTVVRAPARGSAADDGRALLGRLFDIEGWQRRTDGSFAANRQALQRTAAMAPPATRNAARLELAQLLFSHGGYADALGILQVIEEDEPERAGEPAFLALRGGARYWLRDYERAAVDLGHPALDGFGEAALWRAGLAAARGDWAEASRLFTRAEGAFRAYPPLYRFHFGLFAAEAALDVGDVGLAKFHLDSLDALDPDRAGRSAIDHLRGRLLARALDTDGAAAAWSRAIAGPDRRIRVLATLARTELLLEKKRIDTAQAIEVLETLRYAWRGDDLEFTVLRRLGAAYIAASDYRNGLTTLRELATHFPDHPDVNGVIDQMRAAFVKLYAEGAADRLPPLTALALYDQFRELTPEGATGNELIARLAERLVEVDLLDRAATLLRHLVDQRLQGADRFDAQNRLALVYLLDRKPEEALATVAGQMPADIFPGAAAARRHLTARALIELARYREALTLLAADTSLEAETLRADIHWKTRDWAGAARAYGRIVAATAQDAAGLDRVAGTSVMALAIAHALAGDRAALARLRADFLARMAATAYGESFDVVTASSDTVPADYGAIVRRVAEADRFRSFMQGYREKLMTRGTASRPAEG